MDVAVEPEGAAVTFMTDNADVATVQADGTVTATGEGTANLTASVTGPDGTTVEDTIPITVTEAPTLTLNRTSWYLDPNLAETATHGAVYLEGRTTGLLDDAVVRWRIEPLDAPKVLYPRDQDEREPVDPYTAEGIPTPFATPTKIRWNWRPDKYGTEWEDFDFPLMQTSVCSITTGGRTIEATTEIEIYRPNS